jgi:hypothetical protein
MLLNINYFLQSPMSVVQNLKRPPDYLPIYPMRFLFFTFWEIHWEMLTRKSVSSR